MSKKERKFPIEFKHEDGGTIMARNEVQASAFEKLGFEEVKSKSKKDKDKDKDE